MKKDLFIKLLKEFRAYCSNKEVSKLFHSQETLGYESLLKLTDGQVQDVLNTWDTLSKIPKLYLYLYGDNMDSSLKGMLNTCIFTDDVIGTNNTYYVLPLIESFKKSNRDDIHDFAMLLMNSLKREQTKCASEVASDLKVLQRHDAFEIVKTVINAEEEHQAFGAKSVATNPIILKRDDALEFVEVVSKAKCNANYAAGVATSPNVLERDNAIEFVKIVANTKYPYQGQYAGYVANDEKVLRHKDALEIVKAVANAKELFQVKWAWGAINDDLGTIWNKDALKVINFITSAKEEYQAEYAAEIATDVTCLSADNALKAMEIILNTTKNFQAKYACDILTTCSSVILQGDDRLEIAEKIANCEEREQAKCARDVAVNRIIMARSDGREIVETILNAEYEHQARYASTVAIYIVNHAQELYVPYSTNVMDHLLEIVKLLVSEKEKVNYTDYAYYAATNKNVLRRRDALDVIREAVNTGSIIEPAINSKNDLYVEQEVSTLMKEEYFVGLIDALDSSDINEITKDTKVKIKIKNNKKG